jgi:hypothetical protein
MRLRGMVLDFCDYQWCELEGLSLRDGKCAMKQ